MSPRSTQLSRLERLTKKGLIKKSKNGLYHSLDYKPSKNDTHNLWISSLDIDFTYEGYQVIRDVEIQRDKDSIYRFSRIMYDDDFISDLVVVGKNKITPYEIELNKKNDESVKNKIQGYIENIRDGKFTNVYYYSNNLRVIKQIEYYLRYFNCDVDIKIVTSSKEELLIK